MAESGTVALRSPANIAVVKYWGKKGDKLPVNPSISMSLLASYTEIKIDYIEQTSTNGPSFTFRFDGIKNALFESKIASYLKAVSEELPLLKKLHLDISSANSFPHSSGIASSASSISALAIGLCTVSQELSKDTEEEVNYLRKASMIARLGSGSACRSVYGGWALWGKTARIKGSSDSYAIPLNDMIHNTFNNYHDAILVISSKEKKIPSSEGHKLMETNPYRRIKERTGKSDAIHMIETLKTGDEESFRKIVEYEAMNLHAMFLTSNPYFILMEPGTLHVINRILDYRKETGLEFCFSLDAGPNVHLLYPARIRTRLLSFINSELTKYCENGKWIDDKIGNGPEPILPIHFK